MGKLAAPVRVDKEMMFTNRQLVALMWPLLLEQLLAITVGLADSLMVATVGDCGDQRGVAGRFDQQSDDLHFLGDGDRRQIQA